jgi:hypothetical protein
LDQGGSRQWFAFKELLSPGDLHEMQVLTQKVWDLFSSSSELSGDTSVTGSWPHLE